MARGIPFVKVMGMEKSLHFSPFSLTYHPLEALPVTRPVDRHLYLKKRCRGKRVLDLGALDETVSLQKKHSSWRWLHAEVAEVAAEVMGIDCSLHLRKEARIQTGPRSWIEFGQVEQLTEILERFKPDLVLAGELIEHTPNPLQWISSLNQNRGPLDFILTTPNATSIINLCLAFFNRENMHPDHLQVYSYKTLTTLAKRLEMKEVKLTPYYYHSDQFRNRVHPLLLPLIYALDYGCLTPLQYIFPMTAFGYILEGILEKK